MIKDKKRHKADCLVIAAGLIVVAIITKENAYLYVAISLSILSSLSDFIAKYISFAWQGIGMVLGFFISKILLTIIFYLFLFPISLLQKLFSRKRSISNKKEDTYWIIKEEEKEICFTKPW